MKAEIDTDPNDCWSFHGILCSQQTADKWRASLNRGVCPWCHKPVAKRYRNQARHLQTCPERNYLEAMTKLAADCIKLADEFSVKPQ